MLRSFNEIMEIALVNSLAYIPTYIQEREQEKKLNKYPHKRNLRSRKKKGC
jgi:hypothetical protein